MTSSASYEDIVAFAKEKTLVRLKLHEIDGKVTKISEGY